MLQKIRDRISGWFASVFLGAIAVVFIFWGIQFESNVATQAASVNGDEISAQAVQQAWQQRQTELQQQLRDEIPAELAREEQQRLLDQFIDRELLVQRAHDLGYRVSDRELADTLASFPALQVDGKFDRDRYAALLRQQGRTEAQFEQEFRRDLESTQLRNAIAVSSFATPSELQRRVRLEGEKREVAYAVIPASAFAAQVEVTQEQVAAHYEQNKAQFMTTETVALQYLRLDLADVASQVEVTEEALRRFYDENAARHETPERRRASHILVESGSDDAAAKKEAEALLARAKAGEDFAKLARENSDDPGSREAGGDLGWATREAYVAEFSEALFGIAEQGTVVGPVRTQFGYHLIRLDGVEQPHVRSFEEARAELEPEFRREQAQAAFYEKSQQLADESFAALTELESVGQKLGLPLRTATGFTRAGGGDLGNSRELIDAVFGADVLQERQNSQPIALGEESVVVVRVTDHQPAQQRPIEDVREQIVAVLREEQSREAAAKAAAALAERLRAGEALAAVAVGAGARLVTTPQTVSRSGEVGAGEPLAPELVQAIFKAPRPADGKASAGTATLASGDQAVFVVSTAQPGELDAATAAMELPVRTQQASQLAAAVEFTAYLEQLKRDSKIKKNDKLFATE